MMMNPKTNNLDQFDANNSDGKGTNSILSAFSRKRRHTFDVTLKVERVLSLPYANGKFFFKIRLLNGGNHVNTCSERFEVHENTVEFNLTETFRVKMASRIDNFTLDHCYCRISIRKEGRGGRSYEKIGYCDLDLASFAGCGDESRACLLNPYHQTNTGPANAYLEIRMKLAIVEGDHIFRRPNSDHPYHKGEQVPSTKKLHETIPNECSSRLNGTAVELHPSLTADLNRGHSRQASKSSVCSNYSSASINSSNCTNHYDKMHIIPASNQSAYSLDSHSDSSMSLHTRQNSDEESNTYPSQRRAVNRRRPPFIDQSGDIQRRLHSTRIDAAEIVENVISQNQKSLENSTGYLCLMYNEDGTAHVGSSSSCQKFQTPSSLFVST